MGYFRGVDLVVVNYQTPDDLEGFLTSYINSDIQIPNTLHVVNVEPTDRDKDVALSASLVFPFLYTEHEENVGYARACNAAVRHPDREVVAFFNADTRLSVGVVETCHAELMGTFLLGVVGPKQVDSQNRITSAGIFGTRAAPRLRGWKEQDLGQYDENEDCVSVSGSAYFVKRRAWDYLAACPLYPYGSEGAFLPTQHYYEETFLSYHALEHGWGVRYVGQAKMMHEWHKASPVGSVESRFMRVSQELFRETCDLHGIDHD